MAILNVSFMSRSLKRTVPINVLLPTDATTPDKKAYTPAPPYKTLYLLHGIAASNVEWVNRSRVFNYAQEAGICVVMPTGNSKFYCDSDITGDYYGRFITEDLIEFVENSFPVSKKREDRFIAGLSMGGYGAVVNGLRHPELYSYIGAFSSAFIKDRILNSVNEPTGDFYTRRQYEALFGLEDAADFEGSINDYDALARTVAASDGLKPDLYICCGSEDFLIEPNRAFHALLDEIGYAHAYEEWPGVHNWDFWDEAIRRLIARLPLKKD